MPKTLNYFRTPSHLQVSLVYHLSSTFINTSLSTTTDLIPPHNSIPQRDVERGCYPFGENVSQLFLCVNLLDHNPFFFAYMLFEEPMFGMHILHPA